MTASVITVVEVTAVFVGAGHAASPAGGGGTAGQQQHGAVLPGPSATGALPPRPDDKHATHQQLQQVIMSFLHAWPPCCAVHAARSPCRPVSLTCVCVACHTAPFAILFIIRFHLRLTLFFSFLFLPILTCIV